MCFLRTDMLKHFMHCSCVLLFVCVCSLSAAYMCSGVVPKQCVCHIVFVRMIRVVANMTFKFERIARLPLYFSVVKSILLKNWVVNQKNYIQSFWHCNIFHDNFSQYFSTAQWNFQSLYSITRATHTRVHSQPWCIRVTHWQAWKVLKQLNRCVGD